MAASRPRARAAPEGARRRLPASPPRSEIRDPVSTGSFAATVAEIKLALTLL